ncbi:MAG: ATP-grasp domain-containing protein [Acetobacteraceae bacterium]
MNVLEGVAKAAVLRPAGIPIPDGRLCRTADEAGAAAAALGGVVVKAQIPAGKRGKSGGIRVADTAAQAKDAAHAILGMEIAGNSVASVLVEQRASVARELYAAVLMDAVSGSLVVLLSTEGGMDIEELAATNPAALHRHAIDVLAGFSLADAQRLVAGVGLGAAAQGVAAILAQLYTCFVAHDAELLEINPLAILSDGTVRALDCKLGLDDAALVRQEPLARLGAEERMTPLERRGRELGLKYIELDGAVGVLANGAGLTMATMDAIRHFGGQPANFLEIGGDAYTKSEPALALVLDNPHVRSLIVNFCGAYARTDVMAAGVAAAWQKLQPRIPVFFSIHGTGEDEAVALVERDLAIRPFDVMDDAVRAAVEAAR